MPLSFDPVEEARRHWGRLGETQPIPAGDSLIRAAQIIQTEGNRVLRPLKLTIAQYEVLMLLEFSRNRSLPMSKIGERLQVHPTSVTSTVDRLETEGLVRRVAVADDRRAVLAAITDEGRLRAKQATAALRAAELSIRQLSEDEIEQLTALLRKLRYAAGDFELADARSMTPAS